MTITPTIPGAIQIEPAFGVDGFGTIGIHVGTPAVLLLKQFFPAKDPVSLFILRRLLELALSTDKSDAPEIACCGTFSDGILLARSRNPLVDGEIIWAELERVALDGICQIAVHTRSGWLCVHPSPGARMAYAFDAERFELFTQQFLQAARTWTQALGGQLTPKPSQDPPGQ